MSRLCMLNPAYVDELFLKEVRQVSPRCYYSVGAELLGFKHPSAGSDIQKILAHLLPNGTPMLQGDLGRPRKLYCWLGTLSPRLNGALAILPKFEYQAAVDQIVLAAVDAFDKTIDKDAFVRSGKGGREKHLAAHVAHFSAHGLTRDGEPNVHVNMLMCVAGARIDRVVQKSPNPTQSLAERMRPFRMQRRMEEEFQRNVIKNLEQRFGWRMGRDPKGLAVPLDSHPALVRLTGGGGRRIDAYLKANNLPNTHGAKAVAALASRPEKREWDLGERLHTWRKQGLQHIKEYDREQREAHAALLKNAPPLPPDLERIKGKIEEQRRIEAEKNRKPDLLKPEEGRPPLLLPPPPPEKIARWIPDGKVLQRPQPQQIQEPPWVHPPQQGQPQPQQQPQQQQPKQQRPPQGQQQQQQQPNPQPQPQQQPKPQPQRPQQQQQQQKQGGQQQQQQQQQGQNQGNQRQRPQQQQQQQQQAKKRRTFVENVKGPAKVYREAFRAWRRKSPNEARVYNVAEFLDDTRKRTHAEARRAAIRHIKRLPDIGRQRSLNELLKEAGQAHKAAREPKFKMGKGAVVIVSRLAPEMTTAEYRRLQKLCRKNGWEIRLCGHHRDRLNRQQQQRKTQQQQQPTQPPQGPAYIYRRR